MKGAEDKPGRPTHPFTGRSALLLRLLLLAAAWALSPAPVEAAPAPGRGTVPEAALLVIKTAPADAFVFLDGRAMSLVPASNGARKCHLSLGGHELLLLADGHVASKIALDVVGAETRVEAKLERAGSALALAGFGTTGARPKSVAFSPDGSFLICPLLSGSGADLIDASTLQKKGRLEPPLAMSKAEGFVESAFLPLTGEIWVSQMHNSMIHAFDLATLTYKDSFPSGGSYPKVIAVAADGTKAFISNWVSEDVTVVDARTRKLLAKIPVGTVPRGLCPSPDGKWLFVSGFGNGAIYRVDLESYRLSIFRKADGGAKRHLALDSSRDRLYATDMARDSLFVVNGTTGGLVAEIPIGSNPNTCALSPDGRWIFACTRGPNGSAGYELPGPLAGELIVVDAMTLNVVYRQWGGNQPTGLALSPDGRRVVFTDFLDRRVEAYDVLEPIRAAKEGP